MKKATLFAFGLVLGLTILFASTASAQDDKQLNLSLSQGKACLEYKLHIPSLEDNDHRIYWKQDDCIIIHVTNNPFLYIYSATVDETKIAEDDVISTLGGQFGLKQISSSTNASQPKDTLKQLDFNELLAEMKVRDIVAPVTTHRKKCTADEEKDLLKAIGAAATDAADSQFLSSATALSDLKQAYEKLKSQLADKDTAYVDFQTEYLEAFQFLRRPDSQQNLEKAAYKLQSDALKRWQELTRVDFEMDLVRQFEAARLEKDKLDKLQSDISTAKQKLDTPGCVGSDGTEKERAAAKARFDEISEETAARVKEIEAQAAEIANLTCIYKERKHSEYAWVHDQIYMAITSVLANHDAFGFAVRREGPFTDPTSAVLSLKRDRVADQTETTIPIGDNSAMECSSDPTTIFDKAKPTKTLADIPAPDAKPTGLSEGDSTDKTLKATDTKKKKDNSTKQDPNTLVLTQPWIFGRPRLILSGGITPSFLAQKDYQRVTTGSGSAASAVVGLKTDSRYRLTPMLYGHVLLWYSRHSPDAWYGTLGVTAKNDSKGTDPEFLAGFSRSFVQQRFFFTAGAYIGQKQKLDGGLQLGQTIPSGITGELPVTKGYHVGWGIGISYRFTSTKDPQKSATATQSGTGSQGKSGK